MNTAFRNFVQKYKRKERRKAIAMFIIGVLFTASGVFIWVTGSMWLALTSIAFGLAVILGGVLGWSQADGSDGSLMVALIACVLFVILSALMIINAVVSPQDFQGHRSPIYALIAGTLGLAFFGPGLIVLIVKLVRKSSSRSNSPGNTENDVIR